VLCHRSKDTREEILVEMSRHRFRRQRDFKMLEAEIRGSEKNALNDMVAASMNFRILCLVGILTANLSASAASAETCVEPPARDCTPIRECSFQTDARDCQRCFAKIGGTCLARMNDPGCEAAKAAQQAMIAAKKNACEAEKSSEKLSCEATQMAVKAAFENCKARSTEKP
jgi:hypothetical protein